MSHVRWSDSLSVGVSVLDRQHKQIVQYLNELDDARSGADKTTLAKIIEETVYYTESHFSFEEDMMEQAKYPFLRAHKRVHELFIKRVGEFKARFEQGEDITDELHDTLVRWLVHHIQGEDADYAEYVQKCFAKKEKEPEEKEAPRHETFAEKIQRFFGRKPK